MSLVDDLMREVEDALRAATPPLPLPRVHAQVPAARSTVAPGKPTALNHVQLAPARGAADLRTTDAPASVDRGRRDPAPTPLAASLGACENTWLNGADG